ncbi:MAG: lactate utilization protein [Actinobacteria bacterium]|nr:lactate utilization protein [Actinomycetota bacterium]MCL5883655.1 lactate utilization protein [Actinomycetota bacterium]
MEFVQLPEPARIERAAEGIRNRGMYAETVQSPEQALERLVSLIPEGASVMTGASVTLEKIGFIDLLISGKHPWKNLKDKIFAEKDPARLVELRRRSTMADYFMGSVHAITEAGELVIASASGSQLPAYAYCARNIIWIAGTQKIVPDLDSGFRRLREYVFPLEDRRMKSTGAAGSAINKVLVIYGEPEYSRRMVTMILVNEKLGF